MRLVVHVDRFPVMTETFVVEEIVALGRAGHEVRVETVDWGAARGELPEVAPVTCLADDSRQRRARDLAWLAARHPLAVLGDLRSRRRWAREEVVLPVRRLAPMVRRLARDGERHIHAHFAAGAALDALRIARLAGISYSVTAHAYDIYQRPTNLREKLRCAAFATSGCAYTVRDLRRIVGPDRAAAVHEIVMGVDGRAFQRRRPYPGGRSILAVGRLVEKKGFADLVDAVGRMRAAGAAPDRVRIVGEGPLAEELASRSAACGVDDLVELVGALPPAGVRAELEAADVLCMPCVVAADGDRDSMPVVVKEALAMEVPVVATDEVGLPEVVRPEWGTLVPPRDPAALAAALAELLSRPAEEREAMGRSGRAHVLSACDIDAWTARLGELFAAAGVR
jgi:colanic acid/amylovoran biosynthesis glycosyltransferase